MSNIILSEIEVLINNITDPRSVHGKRYSFEGFMTAIILGIMCGKSSYRQLGDFIEHNGAFLRTHLHFKDALPKYVAVGNLLKQIGKKTSFFNNWAMERIKFDKNKKYWCSADGKALASTISNPSGVEQSLIQMVSIYCADMKSILSARTYEGKKEYEADILIEMITELKTKNVEFCKNIIVTLDALHCQKKL